jgi:hypothetical protein
VICILLRRADRVEVNVKSFRWVLLAVVCLGGTGRGVAWAEPAHDDATHDDWVDDPFAPHVTRGTTARVGSAVGFIYGEVVDVSAIGLTTAIGQRFGRLAVEAELDYLSLNPKGPSSARVGDAERLGVVARFDVIRIGSEWVGANSLLSFYVEGGAAVAWNHWYRPEAGAAMRVVPEDSKRVEGQLGFGVALDHRLQQPIGFPHRIGWFLGWRLALAPHAAEAATVCRGAICRAQTAMTDDRFVDRSMLFQSSLSATW